MKIMQTIHTYDVNLFLWVNQRKSQRFLVRCARCLSKTGDGYLYLVLAAALGWSFQPIDLLLLSCLAVGFLIERPIYLALKNLCRRERPPAALKIPGFIIPSDRFSFPSGHTSAAFLVATLLSFFHPALTPFLLPWAVLVGMARVVLAVHFPTDTLIGALMGTVLALTSLEIVLK
jgi:undecaprenyl-diphosphatase